MKSDVHVSRIHEDDLNALIHQAIINESYHGIYIASAPNPVTNADFMRALRKSLGVSIGLPAPAFLTRLGARLIFRTDPELALHGKYVKSERLEEQGFVFKFREVEEALRDLVTVLHTTIHLR